MISMRPLLLLRFSVVVFASVFVLSACGNTKDAEEAKTIEETIADIGAQFAEAENLGLELTTDKLPSDINGIKNAIGSGNRSPAFKGTVDLVTGGVAVGAEIAALDGEVWAKTGLNPEFLLIDPAELDAPDPAKLVGTGDDGLVAIFSSAENLESKGKSREGNLVLETITATVPGKLMASLLPTASAKSDFVVEFRVTEKGAFHDLRMTGEFYKGHKTTYRLKMKVLSEAVTVQKPVE